MSLVLCFAGEIGSGKTSVTSRMSAELGWPRASFGEYLRHILAERGGDPSCRLQLQDLGQELVSNDPTAFCREVLVHAGYMAGQPMIIDGVRHITIFECLVRVVAPTKVKLIYLSAADEQRLARVASHRDDAGDFSRAMSHPVEAELRALIPGLADAVVDAQGAIDEVIRQCKSHIDTWV